MRLLESFDPVSMSNDFQSCDAAENGVERDWSSVRELAIVMEPKPGVEPARCSSYVFKPENILTISRRPRTLLVDDILNKVTSCKELRVFAIFGLRELPHIQKKVTDYLGKHLPESCPLVEHFILDDDTLDIAFHYQSTHEANIHVLEVKNSQSTIEEIMELIDLTTNLQSIFLNNTSDEMIKKIAQRVTTFSASWISEREFGTLIQQAPASKITDLSLDTADLEMNTSRMKQISEALPMLQKIKLAAPLEFIVCLKFFSHLNTVSYDAESSLKSSEIDPDFPIDMSGALEMTKEENGSLVDIKEEDENPSERISCESGLSDFFVSCGHNLTSFSLTLKDRFKKNLFAHLKKNCPSLEELNIFSHVEQFFDTKSLAVPSLKRLYVHRIHLDDMKLIELLDVCRKLIFLKVEKASAYDRRAKTTQAVVDILKHYADTVFDKNCGHRFTAYISTESKEEVSISVKQDHFDISFKQNAVLEVSNRLRYSY